MASLLLSAQLYVFEVGKITVETDSNALNDFVLGLRLGSRHVVIGSLANISNGGQSNTLTSNLQQWSSIVGQQYLLGKSILNYTLNDTAPYSSGIWVDWGTSGTGVSSAYANFAYRLSDKEVVANQSYFVNVTTTVLIESRYKILSLLEKQVNVTINVLNEAQPALAKQITVYYRFLDSWLVPDETNSYSLSDYGNGTYIASFVTSVSLSDVEVSVHVVDQRDIFTQANVTSTQI